MCMQTNTFSYLPTVQYSNPVNALTATRYMATALPWKYYICDQDAINSYSKKYIMRAEYLSIVIVFFWEYQMY